MVMWPAIIKHADDAELVYINDQAEWDSDADLHFFDYDDADYMLDSAGELYTLTDRQNGIVTPQLIGRAMPLQDILGLVKAHASHKGSCCVAKLYAPSIDEAYKIVESLTDA